LDEIAKKYLEPNRSMGTTILNVFYDLYNSIIDFSTKKNEGILPKNKSLYENLIKICFQNEYYKENINKAILNMNKMMNDKNFKELFNIEEDEND
jgi:predicted RNA methylase